MGARAVDRNREILKAAGDNQADFRTDRTAFALVKLEPMTGIEPAYSAWEADVLPLNYIGIPDWPV